MVIFTLRDLQYRAVRFGLVITGTTVVFALVLLMTGLASFFTHEAGLTVRAMGADAWLVPAGASGPFMSAATIDPSIADTMRGAEPMIISRATLKIEPQREAVVVGYRPGGIGLPPLIEGAPPGPGEIVIDTTADLRVGDSVTMAGRSVRISGVSEHTTLFAGLPFVFMDIDEARDLLFAGERVATTIAVDGDVPSAPPGLDVLTADQVAAVTAEPLDQATASVNLIGALLWLVSAMIIGGVVYLSSMERRRDFAVLKAVGSRTGSLLAGLASESVLIALISSLLAAGLQALIAPTFPLPVMVTTADLLRLPIIAAVVALVASVAGMRRVARTDPALAFSGQGA